MECECMIIFEDAASRVVGLLREAVYRARKLRTLTLGLIMIALIQSGISIFGFSVDPALFCFGLIALIFGGLNIIEFKRFD